MSGRQAVWGVLVLLFIGFAVAGPAIMLVDASRLSPVVQEVAPTGSDDPTRGDEPLVVMADLQFRPATLRVPAGTTVVWSNADVAPHTVTTVTADSGLIDPGGSFTMTVTERVEYVCTLHSSMAGTIDVL